MFEAKQNSSLFPVAIKMHNLGFTLVELIIVISILAVLGTIWFISIQGYSSSARDGSRTLNLSNLQKGLDMWEISAGTFPKPEDAITLTASGIAIGYQGFAWDKTGGLAKLSPGSTKDPLDAGIYVTYAVNASQTKKQLMVFLEDGSKFSGIEMVPGVDTAWAGASSYTTRTPMSKGDTLGILISSTGSNLNQPAQELLTASFTGVDVLSTNTSYTAVLSKDNRVTGTGIALQIINGTMSTWLVARTCNEYLKNPPLSVKRSGMYQINPSWNQSLTVYCDMITDGGGWTVVASDWLTPLTQSLSVLWISPSPTQVGMIPYFIEGNLKDFSKEIRVASINDPAKFAKYDISESWLPANLSLKNSEFWYSYSSGQWFSWGAGSPYKCNFSIIVIGRQGCEDTWTLPFPANGAILWAIKDWPAPSYGSANYSWQFIWNGFSFRLGWTIPTSNTLYYNPRNSSYLMVR